MPTPATWLRLAAQILITGTAATAGTEIETGTVPVATDTSRDVTYHGLSRNGIDVFLNIPYGLDTSGEHRFKPARPAVPARGTTVQATSYGPACPQPLGSSSPPLALGNITNVSENCLNLNIARPAGTTAQDRLPVMVFIHGGSFWAGSNGEPTTRPDGLIIESVANGIPVMHVAMNYRLGCMSSTSTLSRHLCCAMLTFEKSLASLSPTPSRPRAQKMQACATSASR